MGARARPSKRLRPARGTARTGSARRPDRDRRASRRRPGRSMPRGLQGGDQRGRELAVVAPAAHAEPPHQGRRPAPPRTPPRPASSSDSAGASATRRQAAGELRQIPVDRLGLPAEGIEPVMVEISGGEVGVPIGREAPRAVVEALAGDVDIVAVEHAVDEAGGEIGRGERRRRAADEIEQPQRVLGIVVDRRLGVEDFEAIADELPDILDLAEEGEPLERADADMAMAKARQHRRAGRRGLVAALERLAGLEQGEALRGVDAERLEHFGREHFAHAAFQRQPAVGVAAVGRLPRALGAEVEQPAAAHRGAARR